MRGFLFIISCWLCLPGSAQPIAPAGVPGALFWQTSAPVEEQRWSWVERIPVTTPLQFLRKDQQRMLNHWPGPDWQQLGFPAPHTIPAQAGTAFTLFVVYQKSQTAAEEVLWSWQSAGQEPLVVTNLRIADLQRLQYFNLNIDASVPLLHTYQQTAQTSKTVQEATLRLGYLPPAVTVPAAQWEGSLAEVLYYPRVLAPLQQRQIESYLALKYGLTLGTPEKGKDYLNRMGKAIWDAEKSKAYHHRIFGLGTDLQSQWQQARSSSALEPDLLEISLVNAPIFNGQSAAGYLPDQAYMIIGDDDAALTWEAGPAGSASEKLARNWKVQLSGPIHQEEMVLKLDLGRWLGGDPNAYEYLLVIDRSSQADFSTTSTEYVPLDYLSAGRFGHFNPIQWDTDLNGSDVFSVVRIPRAALSADRPAALRVYPNPLGPTTAWQWQLRLTYPTTLSARLTNTQGQRLWQRTYSAAEYFAATERSLPAGSYWLHLETTQETFTQKLIVQ